MRILFVALVVLTVAGCSLDTDYFGEYRGVNLLGNYDFDAVETDGTTAKWATTTLGLDPSKPTADPFMRWHRIGASPVASDNVADAKAGTPTVGSDGVSPVYRLEVKNLILNGDFEGSSTGEGTTVLRDWELTNLDGGPGGPVKVTYTSKPTTPAKPISHRGLLWKSTQNGDQLRLNLQGSVFPSGNSPPTFWTSVGYRFRFDTINNSSSGQVGVALLDSKSGTVSGNLFQNAKGWSVLTQNPDFTSNTVAVFSASASFFFPSPASPKDPVPLRIVAVGALGPTDAPADLLLDNVRLLPDQSNLAVRAKLPSLSSGSLPLLPGTKQGMYVLTVEIRDDPLAGRDNRFAAKAFSVLLRTNEKNGISSPTKVEVRGAAGWSTWTTVTFELGADFVAKDSDLGGNSALEVYFSPTYLAPVPGSGVDVGTLLVSHPRLTFNP